MTTSAQIRKQLVETLDFNVIGPGPDHLARSRERPHRPQGQPEIHINFLCKCKLNLCVKIIVASSCIAHQSGHERFKGLDQETFYS